MTIEKTNTILDQIIVKKKARLTTVKSQKPFSMLEKQYDKTASKPTSSFFESIKSNAVSPKFIAEVKRTSPSVGTMRKSFSLEDISRAYQESANVVAISVLTEQDHFGGSNDDLRYIVQHNSHKKPILRKDFIIEKYQILESKLLGADAFLLIASLFDQKTLSELARYGHSIGIEPLVEVHDEEDFQKAISTNARCIGFNSRDLRTFKIRASVHELARQLDNSYGRVIESGINDARYVNYASGFCDAMLIGTYFMQSESIDDAIRSLATNTAGGTSL